MADQDISLTIGDQDDILSEIQKKQHIKGMLHEAGLSDDDHRLIESILQDAHGLEDDEGEEENEDSDIDDDK